MKRICAALSLVATVLLGHAATAWAGPITVFTGIDTGVAAGSALPNADAAATAFRSAITGMGQTTRLIDFESNALGAIAAPTALGSGVTLSVGNTPNTTISATQNQFGTFNTTVGGSHFLRFTTQFVPFNTVIVATATFDFDAPVDAFGAYFTGIDLGATVTLGFSDGSTQLLNINGSNSLNAVFFGFTDPGSRISSLTLTQSWLNNIGNGYAYFIGVDDVQFATAVPEPASMLLLGSGLAALAIRGWTRRK